MILSFRCISHLYYLWRQKWQYELFCPNTCNCRIKTCLIWRSFKYTHIHIHIYVYIDITYINIHEYIYTYVCTYIYLYLHVHIYFKRANGEAIMFPEKHTILFKLRLYIQIIKYWIFLPHFFISLFFFEVYNKIDLTVPFMI